MKIHNIEHYPVLYREVLESIGPGASHFFDGTFGHGGHASLIFEKHPDLKFYFGFDRDLHAIEAAKKNLPDERLRMFHASFDEIDHFNELKDTRFDFALLDLGTSQFQLKEAERGFSFLKEGPLDMRMNQSKGLTVKEWLLSAEIDEIGEVIRKYGEDKFYYRIARAIIERKGSFETTTELASIIEGALPKSYLRQQKIHGATRAFQAFRIYINTELEKLEQGLEVIFSRLVPGGRLAVISFHSLEDRLVKHSFREWEREDTLIPGMPVPVHRKISRGKCLKRKAIKPGEEEVKENSPSRSARLRVFERASEECA